MSAENSYLVELPSSFRNLPELPPGTFEGLPQQSSLRPALIEAIIEHGLRVPTLVSPMNRVSPYPSISGHSAHLAVLEALITRYGCAATIRDCILAFTYGGEGDRASGVWPGRDWISLEPALGKAVRSEPMHLVAAVEAGADPRRIPGYSSARSAVREDAFPFLTH